MNRFFVDAENIGDENITIDNKEDMNHISRVLRLRDGDKMQISDGKEWEYLTEIQYIDKEQIVAKILDKQKFAREPDLRVTLFQGVPKQGKMDLIVQKTTELGVDTIVPVFMDRSVVNKRENYWKKLIRYRTIAEESSKQSGRGTIPEIRQDIDFDEMLGRLRAFDLVLFPYEEEKKKTIKDVLRNLEKEVENMAIIIGPEGGFSDKEARRLKEQRTKVVSLGTTTLRTETAGIVTLSMCMYELEL